MSSKPPAPFDFGALLAQPRNYVGNRYVYAVITSRARGLSIGVNMNPDRHCNFDCAYCEVHRSATKARRQVNLGVMRQELMHLVALARSHRFAELEGFARVPPDLLELKEVALSGDGEPSLATNFDAIVTEVIRVRHLLGPFKLVLITNGSGLQDPAVRRGLDLFGAEDEIWIKLDAGTDAFMRRINGTEFPLKTITKNILAIGRRRPVVIQSLFCTLEGAAPPEHEIDAYLERLRTLKSGGAEISLVQIYSVSRAPARPGCTHLPLAALSRIARRVREETGLRAEVF